MAGVSLHGLKYDDGQGAFVTSSCFPGRGFKKTTEGGGAWLDARKAEEKKRFNAVLSTKQPRTFSQIREERKKAEKAGTKVAPPTLVCSSDDEEDKTLDGFFLMKHCCIDDPSDLCSVNVSDEKLAEVKEEDLALFDNVAYVNASENLLPLESFKYFPAIRELELPLNAVRNVKLAEGDFPWLEMLDLSFNNLSSEDILSLGVLPNLRVLHLTGNNIRTISPDIVSPPTIESVSEDDHQTSTGNFQRLEILLLNDNQLSDIQVFSTLAAFRSLRHLCLANNHIHEVPQLTLKNRRFAVTDLKGPSKRRSDSARRPRSGRKSRMKDQTEFQREEDHSDKSDVSGNSDKGRSRTSDTSEDLDVTNMPPFQELMHLDLSFNQIMDEESLLAVAAWPMLAELVINDNPLTTASSGDPPLLKKYLQERLGISVQRKRSRPAFKPSVEFSSKPDRKVQTQVPKVPKQDVDAIIAALEAPLRRPALPSSSTTPANATPYPQTPLSLERHTPLPPISSVPSENINKNNQCDGDTFFMTQIDEHEVSQGAAMSDAEKEATETQPKKKARKPKRLIDKKYEGYEELLEIEDIFDQEELPPSDDVQGNVRALKYTLDHSLVFRHPQIHLDRPQKPYEVQMKKLSKKTSDGTTKVEEAEEFLHKMKVRETVVEENLATVLKNQEVYRRDFGNAQQLLGQLKTSYTQNDSR